MTRFCQSHKIENLQAGYLTNSFCIFEMIADKNISMPASTQQNKSGQSVQIEWAALW